MIITHLTGGLGNQMFQYALGRRLAIQNNTNLVLELSHYKKYPNRRFELDCFKLPPSVSIGDSPSSYYNFRAAPTPSAILQFLKKLVGKPERVLEHGYMHEDFVGLIGFEDGSSGIFDPKILDTNDNSYLVGVWQSEKYFSDYADQIRQDFTFKKKATGDNARMLSKIVGNQAVSIHVRRGDYITNPSVAALGFLGIEYYKKAINLIKSRIENPVFYIFSDDPDWCRQNFKLSKTSISVNHNPPDMGFEDMRLMRSCRHHIIANSSFSWWGAWLNPSPDKIVIAPQRWYSKSLINSSDIVPEEWIKL